MVQTPLCFLPRALSSASNYRCVAPSPFHLFMYMLLLAQLPVANPLANLLADQRIKHVVVLYEENRAFDHLFGWDKSLRVEGLSGSESNPIDPSEPSKGHVNVFDGAPYVDTGFFGLEPTHEYFHYSSKLDIVNGTPTMNGFVGVETKQHPWRPKIAAQVMQGFSMGSLPITSTLAAEFAVFDKWFAAFPGPSWPNHMFSQTGTAAGDTETGAYYLCQNRTRTQNGTAYPQPTIFDHLLENGHEYARIYVTARAGMNSWPLTSNPHAALLTRHPCFTLGHLRAPASMLRKQNDSIVDMYLQSFRSAEAKTRTNTMDRFFSDAATGKRSFYDLPCPYL